MAPFASSVFRLHIMNSPTNSPSNGSSDSSLHHLVAAARAGDNDAWEKLVSRHRGKLRRMVELRMSPRLKGRVDASDVIQETFVEAARVMARTGINSEIPVHVWLRRLANQKLIQAHRQHEIAACRAAGREQRVQDAVQASSISIARFLVGNVTSPSNVVMRDEKRKLLELALEEMDSLDREVLMLRHFEHLSGPESAEILGISDEAVKKRYVRALEKLQRIMARLGVVE